MTDYSIRKACEADKKEVYDVLVSSFFPDMPLFAACGVKEPLSINDWPSLQNIGNDLSIVAVTKENEIIGVAINILPKPTESEDLIKNTGSVERFFYLVDKESNGLLTNLLKTTMELRIIAVHKKFRKLGISKRLIEESEKIAIGIGVQEIYAVTTGAFMEASFRARNWKSIFKYFYEEHLKLDSTFKVPPLPHDSLTVFTKRFN